MKIGKDLSPEKVNITLESRRQYICTGRGRPHERKGTSEICSSEGDTPCPLCGKKLA